MSDRNYKCAIEAILFASGDSVAVDRIATALELTKKEAEKLTDELMAEYIAAQRGITIIKLENSYQMVSVKEYAKEIRTVMDLRRNTPLSQAALEVLAVIAYNQPVTKAFVEQVRGVDCSGVIGSLTTKDLIEEKGRLELPGRPLIYGTTENFLRCFSLSSLDDLPEPPEKTGDKADAQENTEEENGQLSIFDTNGDDTVITATAEEIVAEATAD
ncbi:MAG: SMC-Scp complex subunit ScpB [Ruminococcaceae bacterium]|nr:SMC-Scp complex subunit ScpB [Oscillospiraceae bacterium]